MKQFQKVILLIGVLILCGGCERVASILPLRTGSLGDIWQSADDKEAIAKTNSNENARGAKDDVKEKNRTIRSPRQIALTALTVEEEQQSPLISWYEVPSVHSEINDFVVTENGTTVFSVGDDGQVVQTEIDGDKASLSAVSELKVNSKTILELDKPIYALALSADETQLALGQNSKVLIFDLHEGRVSHVLTQVEGRISSIAWDPRGEFIVIGSADGGVYVWNLRVGRAAGKNSLDAIETYEGGISSIIGISFHPQGRVIFAAEKEGFLSLWRLLRTERELGLRDDAAEIDRSFRGRERKRFAGLGQQVYDIWLDERGRFLYAAADDGKIYRWKVRGIKQLPAISVNKAAVFGVTGQSISNSAQRNTQLLVASGRGQGISFWAVPEPVTSSTAGAPSSSCLLGRTELFKNELARVKLGSKSKILWAMGKTGSLLAFDVGAFLKRPETQMAITSCLDLNS